MDPIQISKILTDEYSIKILTEAYMRPVCAHNLCMKFDIPIMKCYYLVNQLESAGYLIPVICEPQLNGNIRKYFKSKIKSIIIKIEDGELKLHIDLNEVEEPKKDIASKIENKIAP